MSDLKENLKVEDESIRTALYKPNYDGGSGPRKIDFNRLSSQLLADVDSVENSNISQALKTSKYKALASKFKNALFNDKRKYRGKSLEKRISLKTFASYLSRARKLFDDRLHHSFFKEIDKLAINYPSYNPIFNSWHNKDAATIRVEIIELKKNLKDCMVLIEKYKQNTKNTVLKKTYPVWANSIENNTIINESETAKKLLNDLDRVKVNHEIMYHLTLDATEKSAIKMKTDEKLRQKKRNTILINYPAYINEITKIINLPDEAFNGFTRASIAPLCFALAAASGRRMIEILHTGEIKRISKYKISFTGQAKKRSENESVEREIYSLVDSRLFIKKIETLRNSQALSDIYEIINKNPDHLTKTDNMKINSVFQDPLNSFAKTFFNDKNRVFKDTRAIYARIVYEQYFNRDKRWKNVDEDVFFSEILGHDDEETQLHYKQFKLEDFNPNLDITIGENTRLEALKKLDDDMSGLARQNSAIKIHDWVKEQISINPYANITTYSIRKALTVKSTVVARYMEFVADALDIKKDNGRFVRKEDESNKIIINDDIDNINDHITYNENNVELEEGENEVEKNIKIALAEEEPPQFTAMQLVTKEWLVQFVYKGVPCVWTGKADNMGDAINKAWAEK
ncbi:protelomerase family protein (plasmid) [Orbus sturtevantii]|uniref:protelomerase family protein n=1 Tax=Orbus sturtevantii TaxID=3074109 RepID=UPI00370D64EF